MAVVFLLRTLTDLLKYYGELVLEVKKEVEDLRDDLKVIQGFLDDSSDYHEVNSNRHKAIVEHIRSTVNRGQDALDDFMIEKSRNTEWNLLSKTSHIASVIAIAETVRSIRKDVEKLNPNYDSANRDSTTSGNGKVEQQPTVVEGGNVIGFDEEAEKVISLLREDSEELEVIGIVGMAGQGKTTLANKIYKDDKIGSDFSHRAWAFVSKDCRIEEVFISILTQLSVKRKSIYKDTRAELAKKIKECLMQKKYFIVLDDVWTTSTFDDLQDAFPKDNKHSRILLTTREWAVAVHANLNRPPHDLKFLNPYESWQLLEKKVFGKAKCPQSFIDWGEKIAEKCGGLPLAIVVIAGTLLRKRTDKHYWEDVAKDVDKYIGETGFFKVVARSYNSLPQNLRLCFLYFGLIPRGPILRSKLIRLWVAEGFIEYDTSSDAEKVASEILDEFVNRNLVLVTSSKSNGQIKSCWVHETLRIFCKKEAERQKLYHEIDMITFALQDHRRICTNSDALQFFPLSSGEQLRTLLTFNPDTTEKISLEPKVLSEMLKVFKRLKILEVSSIMFTQFPKELKQLVLLRYLAFSCNLKSIPASISSLWNLQTLIVWTSNSTVQVHQDIWKLFQLRHLQTNVPAKLLPPAANNEKGKENMQTLSTILPESCTKAVLSRTPCIKKLGVRGKVSELLEDGSKYMDNLCHLKHLEILKILNEVTSSVKSLSRKFPTTLRKLTLSATSLSWDDMSILGDLLHLEVLKLKDNAFSGAVWRPEPASFESLRVLFVDRTNLRKWVCNDPLQYPSLIRLVLRNCGELEEVPLCLASSTSFQALEIYCCFKKVVQSARTLSSKIPGQGQVNSSTRSFKLTVYPPDM